MESSRIEIVEVGPRDGLQSESQVLETGEKVEFIRRLADAGLRRIEVASFVNPKRVPQMADAEAVLAALAGERSTARYIGLVLNRKGFDRARAAGCTEVGMAIAASETFSQRNQGCSIEEGVEAWLDIAKAAQVRRDSRADHDLDGVRLPLRRRSAGDSRARSRGAAGRRRAG